MKGCEDSASQKDIVAWINSGDEGIYCFRNEDLLQTDLTFRYIDNAIFCYIELILKMLQMLYTILDLYIIMSPVFDTVQ